MELIPQTVAFGGGEYFEWKVGRLVARDLTSRVPSLITKERNELLYSLMEDFRHEKETILQKKSTGSGRANPLRPLLSGKYCDEDGDQQSGEWRPSNNRDLSRCFDEAFEGPFQALREVLGTLPRDTPVICCGGSMNIEKVKVDIAALISQFGCQPDFIDDARIPISLYVSSHPPSHLGIISKWN